MLLIIKTHTRLKLVYKPLSLLCTAISKVNANKIVQRVRSWLFFYREETEGAKKRKTQCLSCLYGLNYIAFQNFPKKFNIYTLLDKLHFQGAEQDEKRTLG